MFSRPENCKCFQFCDFISLNRYYGWYILGGYETGTAEIALRSELEGWKAKNLNKPFVFTEYGADTDSSLNKLPSVMWSQDYQIEILKMSHRVFDAFEFIKGEQVWAFADFQTGEAIHRLDGNKKGIFTRQRQPKAAAYYLKQRWESLPLNYKEK
jgi:beta-glucuronidase